MKNLKMYILVNEQMLIGKGKLAGQVGHAVGTYERELALSNPQLLDEYYKGDIKKIVLYAKLEDLKWLEGMNGITTIRDKGYTELEPNTLTCVNIGILDGDNIPEDLQWIKKLKLV